MFRRRTSSPGKIHYRVNINKNMCLGVVDIYIDGKPYQHGFLQWTRSTPREDRKLSCSVHKRYKIVIIIYNLF